MAVGRPRSLRHPGADAGTRYHAPGTPESSPGSRRSSSPGTSTPSSMAKYGARLHPMTRPNFIEFGGIQRVIQWCEATGGSSSYIVHMSTGEGTDIVRAAQFARRAGVAETCAQYLVLDDAAEAEDGHLFACWPRSRTPKDVERLWKDSGVVRSPSSPPIPARSLGSRRRCGTGRLD